MTRELDGLYTNSRLEKKKERPCRASQENNITQGPLKGAAVDHEETAEAAGY